MSSLRKRGKVYYASCYVNGKERRTSLETSSRQVAKERLRNFETAVARGALDDVLPTQTPVAEIVGDYAAYIKNAKSKNGVKVDFWYLRRIFGPVCSLLTRETDNPSARKQDRLQATYLEDIRTSDISAFIAKRVQEDGIGPKTANRYREILLRVFNWAINQRGVRIPGGQNPAKRVERYRERASAIRFLSMQQIGEQLNALEKDPPLRTIVALYIYAGLRREEALWLTLADVDLKAGRYGMIRVRAKNVLGEFWEPKTKVNRVVPVSSALRPFLERYVPAVTLGRLCFPSPKVNVRTG
jgi:integrase